MTAAENMVTNYDKIHYTSYFESDKVTGVYTGQVTVGSSSAFFTTYLKSAVATDLPRKSFTQMRYSLDGTTWQDGDSRTLTYSGGSLQYYLVVTSSSNASSAFIHVSNAGAAAGAPQRTIYYQIVVFSSV